MLDDALFAKQIAQLSPLTDRVPKYFVHLRWGIGFHDNSPAKAGVLLIPKDRIAIEYVYLWVGVLPRRHRVPCLLTQIDNRIREVRRSDDQRRGISAHGHGAVRALIYRLCNCRARVQSTVRGHLRTGLSRRVPGESVPRLCPVGSGRRPKSPILNTAKIPGGGCCRGVDPFEYRLRALISICRSGVSDHREKTAPSEQ